MNQSDSEDEDDLARTLERLKAELIEQEVQLDKENPMPWLPLLTYPSKALWRSSPKPPPQILRDEQFNMIKKSERTNKQLKRTYDRIIANHSSLSLHRERERRRIANGDYFEDEEYFGVSKNVKMKSTIKPVYYKPEQSVCSLKYRLLPNYNISKRVLSEARSLLGKEVFQPKKLLDVGIGVGSSSAAALEVFETIQDEDKIYNGIEWVHGIDPSQSMRDIANVTLKNVVGTEGNRTRVTLSETLSFSNDGISTKGTFDLALCTYTLCELPSVKASLSMAAIIWEKLAPNGVAIFIEPGKKVFDTRTTEKYP